MPQRTLIDNVEYEIMQGKIVDDDYAERTIFEGRTLVDNINYKIILGKPLYKYEIGESVFTYVNETITEFIVVHHGNPNTDLYVGCDNGTWLLQKNIWKIGNFGKGTNGYAASVVHSDLNTSYIPTLPEGIQDILMEIKLPYCVPDYIRVPNDKTEIFHGDNGLSTKAFILSAKELGFNEGNNEVTLPTEGSKLDYFDNSPVEVDLTIGAEKRIATYNEVETHWWTRTPWITGRINETDWMSAVDVDGTLCGTGGTGRNWGVRPCIILPSTTRTDGSGIIRT